MITAPPTTPIAARRHITQMADADLEALIDTKILGFDPWCYGHIDYLFKPGEQNLAIWQCTCCGASEYHGTAGFLIGDQGRHVRLVPAYTANMRCAWPIIERIEALGRPFEATFLLNVASLIRPRVPLTSALLFRLRPRTVAVAALAAFGIIDEYGFVAPGQEEQG